MSVALAAKQSQDSTESRVETEALCADRDSQCKPSESDRDTMHLTHGPSTRECVPDVAPTESGNQKTPESSNSGGNTNQEPSTHNNHEDSTDIEWQRDSVSNHCQKPIVVNPGAHWTTTEEHSLKVNQESTQPNPILSQQSSAHIIPNSAGIQQEQQFGSMMELLEGDTLPQNATENMTGVAADILDNHIDDAIATGALNFTHAEAYDAARSLNLSGTLTDTPVLGGAEQSDTATQPAQSGTLTETEAIPVAEQSAAIHSIETDRPTEEDTIDKHGDNVSGKTDNGEIHPQKCLLFSLPPTSGS